MLTVTSKDAGFSKLLLQSPQMQRSQSQAFLSLFPWQVFWRAIFLCSNSTDLCSWDAPCREEKSCLFVSFSINKTHAKFLPKTSYFALQDASVRCFPDIYNGKTFKSTMNNYFSDIKSSNALLNFSYAYTILYSDHLIWASLRPSIG